MAFENMNKKLPPVAKSIRFYRNGDNFFPGRKFVINPRQIKDMDTLYNYATDVIKPSFGAVRNIYTPENGTRISNLSELSQSHSYVVGGFEHFKRLPGGSKYDEIGTRLPRTVKKTYSHIKPVSHGRFQKVPGRWRVMADEINHPIQLWLHVNGDGNSLPVKFLLPSRIIKLQWDMILEYITARVGKRLGSAVRKLYTIEQEPVYGIKDLVSGQTYIACGYEKFKITANYLSGGLGLESPRRELKRKPLPPIGIKKGGRAKSSYGKNAENDEVGMKFIGGAGHQQAEQETFKPKGAKGKGAKEIKEDTNTKSEVPVEKTKARPISGKKR